LTQCQAEDFEKYKTFKSAQIKENLSRILEKKFRNRSTVTSLLDCWVVIKVDMNYVRFRFLTMVLRFKIQVSRDVSLSGGARCYDLNPEDEVTMPLLKQEVCVEKNVKRRFA
jgi:hypothetical protein